MSVTRALVLIALFISLSSCTERQVVSEGFSLKSPVVSPSPAKDNYSLKTGEQLLQTYSRLTGMPVTAGLRFEYESMLAQLPAAPDPQGLDLSRVAAIQRLAAQFCVQLTDVFTLQTPNGVFQVSNARNALFTSEAVLAFQGSNKAYFGNLTNRGTFIRTVLNKILGQVDAADTQGLAEREADVAEFDAYVVDLVATSSVSAAQLARGVCVAALSHPRLLLF